MSASITYRPEIDGLRAIAVLLVIGYHAFPTFVTGGFVGVDVFFVISGYLISLIIFNETNRNNFSLRVFYLRRIKRIFPALIFFLLITLFLGWAFLLPKEFKLLGKHIFGGVAFISNFFFMRQAGYFDPKADTYPLMHLWSLAIEEQFYILWPGVVLLILKCKKIITSNFISGLMVISFTLNLVITNNSPDSAYFLPLTRFWELLMGCFLAYHHSQKPSSRLPPVLSVLGLALILVSVVIIDRNFHFPGVWALLPTIGALVLIASSSDSVISKFVLRNQILVGIGLISYPLYLWHWGLICFTRTILSATSKRATILSITASFILSIFTYYFVERPIRFGSKFKNSEIKLIVGMGALALLGLLVSFDKVPPRSQAYDLSKITSANEDWYYLKNSKQRIDGNQGFVTLKGARPNLVGFLGDSNMDQFIPAIEEIQHERGQLTKSAFVGTRGGCPLVPKVKMRRYSRCDNFVEDALKKVDDLRIDTIIIGNCWYCYFIDESGRFDYYFDGSEKRNSLNNPDMIDASLKEFSTMIKSMMGKSVYILLNIPVSEYSDPNSLIDRLGDFSLLPRRIMRSKVDSLFGEINEKLREIASAQGAHVIDLVPELCDKNYCMNTYSDGMPIYRDKTHLRPTYTKSMRFLEKTLMINPGFGFN